MKILVTGTEGYLGCLLAPRLLHDGHDVLGIDTGYFSGGWLYAGVDSTPRTLRKDIRRVTAEDFTGVDAVVHLAELSNDPLGELAHDATYAINYMGSVHLARLAKAAGVERFVYVSSCSVYGMADDIVDEASPVNPQTTYAKCKVLVERDLSEMADDTFSPTSLRNGTAFGASPRMRFDVVLNNLAGLAWTTGEIILTSDGTPWRPLVHALDVADAIRCVLSAPRDAVHAQVLNVGHSSHNYRIRDIAEAIAETFPVSRISMGKSGSDRRSYRVNFDKIRSILPTFLPQWDAHAGALQLHNVFAHVKLNSAMFSERGHIRLTQFQHLIATKQLDPDFYWTTPDVGNPSTPRHGTEDSIPDPGNDSPRNH